MPMVARFREAAEVWEAMGRPRCYLIGGSVRDRLLGRASADLDFAVVGDAGAAEAPAQALASVHGVRAHLLGQVPRCVWRIESKHGLKVELWPMGELSLAEDVRRRDFSCNALVWAYPEQRLIDLVGGLDDIRQRRLRAIARSNLADDPVRLLRAARFLAQLDFQLVPETTQAISELAPMLARSPRERIGQELQSLLSTRRASRGLQAMIELGLLVPAAPPGAAVDVTWLQAHLAAVAMLCGSRQHPVASAVRTAGSAARLGLLLRTWQTTRAQEIAPYCWSRPQRMVAAVAAEMLAEALITVDVSPADRRQLIYRAGAAFPAVLALAAAVSAAGCTVDQPAECLRWRRWWRQWRRCRNQLLQPQLLIPAEEIATLAGVSGRELGKLIHDLVQAQVRRTVRTPAGARRWLRHRPPARRPEPPARPAARPTRPPR
jgi:hypothetical protein